MTEEIAILKHENKSSLRQIERLTEGNNTLTEEITRYEEKGLTVEELQSEKQQLAEELDNIKQQVLINPFQFLLPVPQLVSAGVVV